MFTFPSFVLLLAILFSFDTTCVDCMEERRSMCFDDDSDDPDDSGSIILQSASRKGPDSYHTSQLQEQEFVPFKILFLIDDQISTKERELLESATKYVNDRLSKIIRARPLADVRIVPFRSKCSVCGGNRTSFPSEYQTRCYARDEPIQAGEDASEKVAELNRQNFTLVVRVLVDGEGITLGGKVETRCRGQLASASECSYDLSRGPAHGRMVYCNKPSEFQSDEQLRGTTLHEIIHVIVPSFTFHHANIDHYDCSTKDACKGKTWKTFTRSVTHEDGHTETVKGFLAIADPLPTIAKKHFHCDEAEGIELQLSPESGEPKPGNHWSEHLFPDELLAPIDAPSARLSAFTLGAIAAYKDWYHVDMSYAEELSISRPSAEMGCDILRKSYGEILREQKAKGGVQSFRPYCDSSQGAKRAVTSHCSDDNKRRYSCVAKGDHSFLTAMRGVYDTDFCASMTKMDTTPAYQAYYTGAWYGPGTICVTFTDIPVSFHDHTNAVCVLYECKMDTRVLVLKFYSNNWTSSDEECFIQCSPEMANQIVTVERKSSCTNMHQGSTSIICPNYDVVCDGNLRTTASVSPSKKEPPSDQPTTFTKSVPGSNAPTLDATSARVTSAGVRGDGFHGTAVVCIVYSV